MQSPTVRISWNSCNGQDHKEQHKISVPIVLAKHFPQNSEASKITWTFNISSPSSRKDPIASRGFSPQNPSSEATAAVVLLRIYGCLGLEKPLEDRNVALRSCEVQRCLASGSRGPMAQARQAEPNGTKGEKKTLREFWHLKSGSFGNCGHSKSSLDLRNIMEHCGFEILWKGHRVGGKSHVNHVGSLGVDSCWIRIILNPVGLECWNVEISRQMHRHLSNR